MIILNYLILMNLNNYQINSCFIPIFNIILVMNDTYIPITNLINSRVIFLNKKRHAHKNFLIVGDVNFKAKFLFGGTFGLSHDSTVLKLSKFKE
ncbi:hypothetical protein A0H76_833 [Hepatospora eriocheir]|uniref:Uncharacterized protein n=1 Tax=Hepatospora eriocheir TaxID=1081669 RepID=A0A1X0QI27_9MICR|nr:hypothetical protein A0H76_833 [Hepatospora eriocheir]